MIFNFYNQDNIALLDNDKRNISYFELFRLADEFKNSYKDRAIVFILADNNIESIISFILSIEADMVPLLINVHIDKELLSKYMEIYKPKYIFADKEYVLDICEPKNVCEVLNYRFVQTCLTGYSINENLAFLLSTSGTTGSPKLVRHSYTNLLESAKNVAAAMKLNKDERAITSLPIYFTQGLNVVLSNLYVGATVLVTNYSIMQKEFWEFLEKEKATSITGVPYSYEIMYRLGFFNRDYPDLKLINQGGGKLSEIIFKKLAEYAQKYHKKFIPTYGSTETTSRMCYLDPEVASKKICSIGKPIEPGTIKLVNENGNDINSANCIGEIIYSGPNVAMGYANNIDDLMLGDVKLGTHHTGDMAYYDDDGYYFIVGRKGRFVKIYGYRLSLDEIEKLLYSKYSKTFACIGNDKSIIIVSEDNEISKDELINYISDKLKILKSNFSVIYVENIPRNSYGKILYKNLECYL